MDIQDTEQLRRASVHAHKGYDTPVQALDAQAGKRPPCGSDRARQTDEAKCRLGHVGEAVSKDK